MALSFVLKDEYAARSRKTLAMVARDGALVPTLWDFEVANALHSAAVRGRLTAAAHINALHGLAGLPVERDTRPVDWLRVTSLARDLSLSVYDASYLDLAIDRNLPLASLDDRLVKAAATAGAGLVR
jgi:predicted nucleic acid-binding protein